MAAGRAFADSVAEFEAWCREEGGEPQKAWTGKMTLRPTSEQRRYMAAAAVAHQSLNTWMLDVLDRGSAAVERTIAPV